MFRFSRIMNTRGLQPGSIQIQQPEFNFYIKPYFLIRIQGFKLNRTANLCILVGYFLGAEVYGTAELSHARETQEQMDSRTLLHEAALRGRLGGIDASIPDIGGRFGSRPRLLRYL